MQYPTQPSPFSVTGKTLTKTLFVGFLLTLGGCLSDGPNETGRDFLASQKVVLNSTAYDITLDSIPLENFHTALDEPTHLGDTVLMLGNWQGVRSELRLGFSLTNTTLINNLDSAKNDTDIQIRLGLGFYNWGGYSNGSPNSTQRYLESTLEGRNSLALVVTTLDAPDSVSSTSYNEVVSMGEPSFLRRKLPVEIVQEQFKAAKKPLVVTRDTIVLDLKNIYAPTGRDSLLTRLLPHLREHLSQKKFERRYLMVQIKPLIDMPLGDSDGVMLRVVGGAVGAYYMPALFIGKGEKEPSSSSNPDRLDTYLLSGSTVRAATFLAEDMDSTNNALTLVPQRGLRFQINRSHLISRLKAKGVNFPNQGSSAFDANYFVSFAEVELPIDTQNSRIENNYSVDLGVWSNLDSLAAGEDAGETMYSQIPIDSSNRKRANWNLLWVLDGNGTLSGKSDTIRFSFEPSPDSLTQFLRFSSARDTSKDLDTLVLKAGVTREITLSAGSRVPLYLSVTSQGKTCDMVYRLRSQSREESRTLLDPETQKPYKEYADLSHRLLSPKKGEVFLRATSSVQRLLNRKTLDQNVFHEFLVKQINKNVLQSDSLNIPVSFPVLGRVQFPQTNGKTLVKLHLLLFPLQQP